MREIKFRGKRLLSEDWEYGNLIQRPDGGHFIETGDMRLCPMQDFSIGQFTGLHDQNGKGIYEGDIIRFVWTDYVGKGKNKVPVLKYVENSPPKVISYRTGAFGYVNFEADEYSEEEWLPILDDPCEVIGNIHDNPELLKTKVI